MATSPEQKQIKTVRFCEDCNTVHENADGLTKAERKPLHYTAQELSQLKSDIYLDIGKFQSNPRYRGFHSRGLETLIDGNYEESLDHRQEYARELIELYEDVHDSDSMQAVENPLRQFAQARGRADRKEAARKAKQDEVEAWRVYKEDKMRFRRTTSRGAVSKAFVVSVVQGLNPRRLSRFPSAGTSSRQ